MCASVVVGCVALVACIIRSCVSKSVELMSNRSFRKYLSQLGLCLGIGVGVMVGITTIVLLCAL